MPINPLNHHYAMENPASVYDEEAMTALELAGRTTAKVNEVVKDQNDLRTETLTRLSKQENEQIPSAVAREVQTHIESGRFDKQVDTYACGLNAKLEEYHTEAVATAEAVESRVNGRMDNFTRMAEGSTTGDAELADMRVDADGTTHNNAGSSVRHQATNLRASVNSVKDYIAHLQHANIINPDFIVGSCAGAGGKIQEWNNIAVASSSLYPFNGSTVETVVICTEGYKGRLYVYTDADAYTFEAVEFGPGITSTKQYKTSKFRVQVEKSDDSTVKTTEVATLANAVTVLQTPIYHENNWYFYLTDFGKFSGWGAHNGMALHYVSFAPYGLKGYSTQTAEGIVSFSMDDIVTLFPDNIKYQGETPYLKLPALTALCFNATEKNLVARKQGQIQHDDIVLIKWGASENILPDAGILATKYLADTNQLMQVSTSSSGEGGISVPDYWQGATEEAIAKITTHQNAMGIDGAVVGFVTDTHIGVNAGNSGQLMAKVLTDCRIPVYVDGGDIVSGASIVSADGILADLHKADSLFSSTLDKRLRITGNHDMVYGVEASYDSELTDPAFQFNFFRNDLEDSRSVFGPRGTYFYRDLALSKIRIICLDSECFDAQINSNGQILTNAYNKIWTHLLGTEQLRWLADEALNLPSDDWHCMVFSHLPVMANGDKPVQSTDSYLADIELLKGVLLAYKNKTGYTGSVSGTAVGTITTSANFSGYRGSLIGCFSGHTHTDYLVDVGFKAVTTANDSISVAESDYAPAKERGTNTEQVIDFICVNKKTRTVNIVRLGAGSDRAFNY